MREFGSSSIGLAGSLLVAHPGLLDPNFRRSVIFISTNDPLEGSSGLVLNRPAGRTVGEVLPEQDLGAIGSVPVFLGGPVGTDQLIFAAFRWHAESERMDCRHHLVLHEAQEAMKAERTAVRAFIGYAGWSKGQLEGELAQHAWLVTKPDRELLRLSRCETLWREATSAFGPQFRLAAEAPDDPSKN